MVNQETFAERIICLIVYSIAIAPSDSIFAPMIVLPIVLAYILRRDLSITLKRLAFLNTFIIIIAASLLFNEENRLALLIFIRSNMLLFVSLILFARADSAAIALGFSKLRAPKKFVALLFFTAKLISILRSEFDRFRRALFLRSFRLKTNTISYRLIASFLGLLIIKCFKRADALRKTMILRGFNGKILTLNEPRIELFNLLFAAIAALSFIRLGALF
ncbi:MAG: energy-coupling factor transporter transmembrane protein EcfT [Helicobacteraceae bacterium]|jgi:cobalt/nickel transport system permease protein|nr:energy-coupling factor transporter transmembrane protein EcfT [Helicobacteraceae bacterium]